MIKILKFKWECCKSKIDLIDDRQFVWCRNLMSTSIPIYENGAIAAWWFILTDNMAYMATVVAIKSYTVCSKYMDVD